MAVPPSQAGCAVTQLKHRSQASCIYVMWVLHSWQRSPGEQPCPHLLTAQVGKVRSKCKGPRSRCAVAFGLASLVAGRAWAMVRQPLEALHSCSDQAVSFGAMCPPPPAPFQPHLSPSLTRVLVKCPEMLPSTHPIVHFTNAQEILPVFRATCSVQGVRR